MVPPRQAHKTRVLYGAARAVVQNIRDLGHDGGIFGEVAYYAFDRIVNPKFWRVNVLVKLNMSRHTSMQQVMEAIIQQDPRFYLRDSDHRFMYRHEDTGFPSRGQKTCSIHLRRTLDILHFTQPFDLIVHHLPLVPFDFLIFTRLQQWDNLSFEEWRKTALARLIAGMTETFCSLPNYSDLARGTMMEEAGTLFPMLVEAFCRFFPPAASTFVRLGFAIPWIPEDGLLRKYLHLKHLRPTPEEEALTVSFDNAERLPEHLRSVFTAEAAAAAVQILAREGYPAAIFGSLACYLYGTDRLPDAVDILLLPPPSLDLPEIDVIEKLLFMADPFHFYFAPATNSPTSQEVLHYRRLRPTIQLCKVNLVVPGSVHLPAFSSKHIYWAHDMPVIPFSLLLMLKLQAWDDHRPRITAEDVEHRGFEDDQTRPESDTDVVAAIDAMDLKGLLDLDKIVSLRYSRPWGARDLFDEGLQSQSKSRVKAFCGEYPERCKDWQDLGFDTT